MGMITRSGIPLKWVSSIKTLQKRSFHLNAVVYQTADITTKNFTKNYNCLLYTSPSPRDTR